MALVLFGVLFLLGPTGMDKGRGFRFSVITGFLLFLWSMPLVIWAAGSAPFSTVFPASVLLITFLGAASLSFWVGRFAHLLWAKAKGT